MSSHKDSESEESKRLALLFQTAKNLGITVESAASSLIDTGTGLYIDDPTDEGFISIIEAIQNGGVPSQRTIEKVFLNKSKTLVDLFFTEGVYIKDTDAVFAILESAAVPSEFYDKLSKWEAIQRRVSEDYEMPYIIGEQGRIQTVEDISAPPVPDDVDTAPAHYYETGDNIFIQAARAGEFTKLLDIYIAEQKNFPAEVLKQTDGEFTVMEILTFKNEDGIWKKLMDPNMWIGQKRAMKDVFYQMMPYKGRGATDFKDVLNRLDCLTVSVSSPETTLKIKRRR